MSLQAAADAPGQSFAAQLEPFREVLGLLLLL